MKQSIQCLHGRWNKKKNKRRNDFSCASISFYFTLFFDCEHFFVETHSDDQSQHPVQVLVWTCSSISIGRSFDFIASFANVVDLQIFCFEIIFIILFASFRVVIRLLRVCESIDFKMLDRWLNRKANKSNRAKVPRTWAVQLRSVTVQEDRWPYEKQLDGVNLRVQIGSM